MQELKELAAETAGHPVPIAANAGLLWPRHLAEYRTLDLFSAETEHHAEQQSLPDLPLFAYRLADAVGRPYAATASGWDWAYIKEHNLPGIVRSWIALSYAAGQCLMVPNRQWCYTPEKGTHWYEGPAEKFAPLYQFVRRQRTLFDDYEAFADIAVVMPHRSYLADPKRWFDLGQQLTTNRICYRLLLGGDEIVDCPLSRAELNRAPGLLVPDRKDLLPADRQALDECSGSQRLFQTVADVVPAVHPAVQVEGEARVRVLPRVKPKAAVVHVLNYDYSAKLDDVQPLKTVKLKVNSQALGVPNARQCLWTDLTGERSLPITDGVLDLPPLGVWGILSMTNGAN
jgi:hypothetical protein